MSKLSKKETDKSVSKRRKNLKNKVKWEEEISLMTELMDLYKMPTKKQIIEVV